MQMRVETVENDTFWAKCQIFVIFMMSTIGVRYKTLCELKHSLHLKFLQYAYTP